MKIFTLLIMTAISLTMMAQDKSFERKKVTDTKKKLDINKKDIADPHKKLDVRSGDLTDTKKLLRKTDSLSKTQIVRLRQDALRAIGKDAYSNAVSNAPNLMQTRLKYGWLRMQLQTQKAEWNARAKRDAQRSGGKLSETRKKDYERKNGKNDKQIAEYSKVINNLDSKMIQMSKNSAAVGTDFFSNTVGDKGARLTDKLGNFIVTLHKGEKVETKGTKLDNRYYEVKHKGKLVFALKEYFLK